ncbi:MAG: isoamylase [Proteobacteria bacterium]|nr:isoamylase [Pseudomonadota bacterium]
MTSGIVMQAESTIGTGRSFPLGATVLSGGVNFSVFSKNASGVELLLFDQVDDVAPARRIPFDPRFQRTYHYWHVFVPGIGQGQLYGYRVEGPDDPARGLRFDGTKVLLDPYGKAVAVPRDYSRKATVSHRGGAAPAMKSAVTDRRGYDWEGDTPLNRPFSRTLIYEMHVRGFTRHPSSDVNEDKRGTYAGLIEKIPYLQDLGITAVELLPVFQFEPYDPPGGLSNYWGYSPVSFFAPHAGYSFRQDPLGPLMEFRDMVKALHRAGIEVILDVVFNHTAEGDERGPTLCFRGLQNDVYYMLESDKSRYKNYSGTGNTLNANHAVVRRLVRDSLRYWVQAMHVDGFRFDLASILSRDADGLPLLTPPLLWDIESDPVLAGTKLIAEAWDAGGLYQVGSFVGDAWKEWNGRFRDDVRSFFRGDRGSVGHFASRLLASPDIFGHEEREPEQSINFVTCHDGFTLNDLVSYAEKHNEANGEDNRDGMDDNRSWNCGVEGPSDDPAVEKLRNRQVKNLLAVTLLALGVPMILMGDEVRRTQRGNNNAYCQDNEVSWMDWSLLDKHRDVHRFVKHLARERLALSGDLEYLSQSLNEWLNEGRFAWQGIQLNQPDWSDWSHSLALTLQSRDGRLLFHAIFNAYTEPLDFELPSEGLSPGAWHRWIDTSRESPGDIVDLSDASPVPDFIYRTEAHTVAVLVASIHGKAGEASSAFRSA